MVVGLPLVCVVENCINDALFYFIVYFISYYCGIDSILLLDVFVWKLMLPADEICCDEC